MLLVDFAEPIQCAQCFAQCHYSDVNERHGVSNHRQLPYLFNRFFRRTSKKTWKPALLTLCDGNPPVAGRFPPQRSNNEENLSILWHHNALHCWWHTVINSSRYSNAYMRQLTWPLTIQIMAWHLVGANRLFIPILSYNWLDPWEQIPIKLNALNTIILIKENAFENVVCNSNHFIAASIRWRMHMLTSVIPVPWVASVVRG